MKSYTRTVYSNLIKKVEFPEKTRLKIRIEAVKPSGILEMAREFRKSESNENRGRSS